MDNRKSVARITGIPEVNPARDTGAGLSAPGSSRDHAIRAYEQPKRVLPPEDRGTNAAALVSNFQAFLRRMWNWSTTEERHQDEEIELEERLPRVPSQEDAPTSGDVERLSNFAAEAPGGQNLFAKNPVETDRQQSRKPVELEILEGRENLQHLREGSNASDGNSSWKFSGSDDEAKSQKSGDNTGQNPEGHEVTSHQESPDALLGQSETVDWMDIFKTRDLVTEDLNEFAIEGEKFLKSDRSTKKQYEVEFEDRYGKPLIKKMETATPWNCDVIANIQKEHFIKVQSGLPSGKPDMYTNYYDTKHGIIICSTIYRNADRIGSENDQTTKAWQVSDIIAEQTKLVLKEQGEKFFDLQTVIMANVQNRQMTDTLELLKIPSGTTTFRQGQKEFAILFKHPIARSAVYLVDQNRELYGEGKICTSVSVHMIEGNPVYMEYHFQAG